MASLAAISQLGDQNLEPFLHALMDQLCGQERSLSSFGGVFLISPIQEAYKKFIIRVASAAPIGKQEIAKKLAEAGLAQAHAELLAQAIEARKPELQERFKEQSSAIGVPQHLEDFDWSLRLVLGSDRLMGMREPRLLLKFSLRDANGRSEGHQLELDADQLDHLLAKFGDVQGIVQQFSGRKL